MDQLRGVLAEDVDAEGLLVRQADDALGLSMPSSARDDLATLLPEGRIGRRLGKDYEAAVLPKVRIERDRALKPQPLHDGEARRVNQA